MKRVWISLILLTNYLTLSLLFFHQKPRVAPLVILSDDITEGVKELSKHEIS